MRRGLAALVAAAVLGWAGLARADHEVVLVTSAQSRISAPSILDIRKVYLGITVRQGNYAIRGLRNLSDAKVDSAFVQSVVAMSERAYERRLIEGSLRFGRPRPAEYDTLDALVAELLASPNSISYMWREDAERLEELKVLEILWHAY